MLREPEEILEEGGIRRIIDEFRLHSDRYDNFFDIEKYFRSRNQSTGIIDAFNHYVTEGLQRQLESISIPYTYKGKPCSIFLKMINPHLPTYIDAEGKRSKRTAAVCRNLGMNYVTQIYVKCALYERDSPKHIMTFDRPEFLGELYIMVGSILCYRSYAKSREELIRLGENPDDSGGYFIRRGKINVIPNTERMQLDKFFILHNKKRGYHARQTTIVPTGTSINEVIYREIGEDKARSEAKSKNLKSCHYTTSKLGTVPGKAKSANAMNSINILHMIDIIGFLFQRHDITSEGKDGANHYGVRKILDLICTDKAEVHRAQVLQNLRATILEYNNVPSAVALGNFLTWMEIDKEGRDQRLKRAQACRAIRDHVFQFVPIYKKEGKYIVEPKVDMICLLACHFLMFQSGVIPVTDKDDWANKKIDTATATIAKEFWKVYNTTIDQIKSKVSTQTRTGDDLPVIISDVRAAALTKGFAIPFTEQGKNPQSTTGSAFIPSQKLHPTNVFELISTVTKIQINTNKTVKKPGLRNIHGSQRLFVCPGKTPDAGNLGIVQHMALLAQPTVDDESGQIAKLLEGYFTEEKTITNRNCLIINGRPVGWCDAPWLLEILYRMRRGDPGKFNVVAPEKKMRCSVTTVWYAFEVESNVRKLVERIEEEKSELTPWELVLDDVHLGFISRESVKALLDWSAIGRIPSRTSFAIDALGHLSIYESQGRLQVPMYVVRDNGRQIDGRRFVLLIDEKKYGCDALSFSELEKRGFIDWIDANETSNPNFYVLSCKRMFYMKIERDEEIVGKYEKLQRDLAAATEFPEVREALQRELDEIRPQYLKIDRAPCRYVALHEAAMYGTAAIIAPSSHHDPAGKTVHTSKTIPQTLGLQSNPYAHEKQHYLLASNVPLASSVIGNIVGDQRSMLGVNATVAFIDMPANQEDAIIISTALTDLKMMLYATQVAITATLSIGGTNAEYLGIPEGLSVGSRVRYEHLSEYGIPPIGYRLKRGDIAISRYSIREGIVKSNNVIVGKGEEGVVKDVMFYKDYGKGGETQKDERVVVSLLVVNVKKPKRGDKFTLPHGQKSVVGSFEDPVNIPTDAFTGLRPDIVSNTHAISGRQTIGVFLDMILGLSAAQTAKFFDTSAFVQHDFYAIVEKLKQEGYGFQSTQFIEPTTGRLYKGISYTGFTRLHQLHHFADQKIDAVGHAELNPVTKRRNKNAATAGQGKGGMESRLQQAYGMVENFRESFITLTDHQTVYVCKSCRQLSGTYTSNCFYCQEPAVSNIYRCEIPSTFKDVKDLLLMNSMRLYSNIGTEEEFAESYLEQLRARALIDGGIELSDEEAQEEI